MRPRTELAIGLAVFVGLVIIALGAGLERRGPVATDMRASSVVAGPAGTRALAEVAQHAGVRVTRWRRRLQALPDSVAGGATLVVVQPSRGFAVSDAAHLIALTAGTTNLLAAGDALRAVHRCLGWDVDYMFIDSAGVLGPSGFVRRGVTTTFSGSRDPTRTLSSGVAGREPCPVAPIASVDTLLRTERDAPVALLLRRADSGRSIVLVSDPALVSNAGLAVGELPEVLVGALLRLGDHVVFDEYHHLGTGGSLWRTTLDWSARSPWGWAIWQLAIVGLLAFLAGAVRFGPVREAIPRARRSPLEHVKALATALAASSGHDVAIAALVRGLQRRLAGTGAEARRGRGARARHDWKPWLEQLANRIPDPAARGSATRLSRYAAPGQPAAAVRGAANAVEELWEALHR
jgi:hypothetical protein